MSRFTRRTGVLYTLAASASLGASSLLLPLSKAVGLLPRSERSFVTLKLCLQQPNGQVLHTVGRFPSEVVTIAGRHLSVPGARLVGLWRGVNGYVTQVQLPTDPRGLTVTGPLLTQRGNLLLKAAERAAGITLQYPIYPR